MIVLGLVPRESSELKITSRIETHENGYHKTRLYPCELKTKHTLC